MHNPFMSISNVAIRKVKHAEEEKDGMVTTLDMRSGGVLSENMNEMHDGTVTHTKSFKCQENTANEKGCLRRNTYYQH